MKPKIRQFDHVQVILTPFITRYPLTGVVITTMIGGIEGWCLVRHFQVGDMPTVTGRYFMSELKKIADESKPE